MDARTKNVAAKAIEFIEAANMLAGDGSALDNVDTSVAGMGEFTPVLDDETLARLKDDLANEGIAAGVVRDLIKIARSVAVAMLGT